MHVNAEYTGTIDNFDFDCKKINRHDLKFNTNFW